ncbi:glycoside hydrolase family 92 protein [Maribellus comscasis]|uniref:Glycoside hydrolase family 92 protein n=1 Tax=Maribellus comscasis TaxID=2681766 RepID=A0A6I6JM18_9BACT|nr:GH92 family glycosyl hydrolase [Maribellus comscasis]QGY42259.1 glycoside hydrolase family 92 protein [Maribellus comscasis]
MKLLNSRLFSLLSLFLFFSCGSEKQVEQSTDYTQFVDPLIGSGYHGHVFVGASVPFGAVQLGPNNETQGWDWCSGYHYSDSVLIGFAHTHLSGTGIGDLGDLVFMPVSEAFNPEEANETPFPWKSKYSHDKETAKAGYYSLHIDRYDVDAELTATKRVGFHKYDFNADGNSKIIIDLKYGTGWDKITNGAIQQANDNSVEGFRFSSGWARDQQLFYYTRFSKDIKNFEILESDEKTGDLTAIIEFEGNGELMVKTGISPVSVEGAENNMLAEIDEEIGLWNFDAVKEMAHKMWNNELGKINVESATLSDKKIFYTALYHTMIAPSLFNDVNGDYRGADRQVHKNPGYDTYTTFSLWDTYRAAHPLYTLTQPNRVNDFVNTMLDIYDQQGKLPVWHLHGNETNTMVGYHAVPVIADAYLKGFRGFDAEKALEAMKAFAMRDERGLDYIKKQEYIPAESQVESVARAMEYAIDDWCIAAMANAMGKTEDAELYTKRSKYYQHYFDKDIHFVRGKMGDGSWRTPFDAISSQHRNDDFCEGNAWQYTWLVPQDPEGLIQLFGSGEAFINKLDSLFTIDSDQVEGASSDISGLIGQYAHGNEPSHHTTYMYAYAGQQWKTAELVREICSTMYTDKNDGLCGNEDCGQMSAWYVLSSMGMYPVNPAAGTYVFGSPVFDEITINLPENKSFTIVAENNSPENIYIQSAVLNGKEYKKTFITHKDILNGGTLKFVMGNQPREEYGAASEDRPQSEVY